jgi:hypothetical protein
MIVADQIGLPGMEDPPPNLALMVMGRVLAEAYRDLTDQVLPEHLACILREIEAREQAATAADA